MYRGTTGLTFKTLRWLSILAFSLVSCNVQTNERQSSSQQSLSRAVSSPKAAGVPVIAEQADGTACFTFVATPDGFQIPARYPSTAPAGSIKRVEKLCNPDDVPQISAAVTEKAAGDQSDGLALNNVTIAVCATAYVITKTALCMASEGGPELPFVGQGLIGSILGSLGFPQTSAKIAAAAAASNAAAGAAKGEAVSAALNGLLAVKNTQNATQMRAANVQGFRWAKQCIAAGVALEAGNSLRRAIESSLEQYGDPVYGIMDYCGMKRF
jgi:hypothetical protein